MLHKRLSLRETLALLRQTEQPASSRFFFGSPCRFVRKLDILVHVVMAELLEDVFPKISIYLRKTSPRWGRSWRNW